MSRTSPPLPTDAPRAPGRPRASRPAASAGRLISLDAVRGVMLAVSVTSDSLLAPPPWYDHAPWAGVHPVDLVFPVFVTLTGCGLAFAFRRRVEVGPVLRRVLVLLAAGLAYTLVAVLAGTGQVAWSTFRLTGVLQLYAAVVVLLALGHLVTRTARGWVVVTALLAVAHTALLAAWAARCPGRELAPGCNPSATLDAALLGAGHLYGAGVLGHDPEGVVAVLGACTSAAAGAAAGHLMLAVRQRGGRPSAAVAPVAALAVGLGLAALAAGQLVPAMKRLWTAPFALGVAAVVVLVLVAVHVALDRPARGAVLDAAAWPLLALGRNSLLVHFGSHLVVLVLTRVHLGGGAESVAVVASRAVAVAGHPQVTWSVLVLAAWVGLACVLHARGLYLRP